MIGWFGCSVRTPPEPPGPLTATEVSALLAEAAQAAAAIRRYQAVLGVRGEGPGGRLSGRMLLVFERPEDSGGVAALRMELFGPVGGPRWTLVARPGLARVVIPGERAFADASGLAEFTERLLGIRFGLEQAAALAVGSGVPVSTDAPARPDPEGPGALLEGGAAIWWERSPDGVSQVRRVTVDGYEAHYPGSFRADGRQVPRRLKIESDRMRATLVVEELRVNAALHPDSFALSTPAGFREVQPAELDGFGLRER